MTLIPCVLVIFSNIAVAAPPFRFSLDDPRKDDRGPGEYIYPSGSFYTPGIFDLRRFEMRREGKDLVFELTFDSPLIPPTDLRNRSATPIELNNGVYVENIDIYLNHKPGGATQTIPGRNVRFEERDGWDSCVVITPQPYLVRSLLEDFRPGGRVIVPVGVRSRGRVVTARIPVEDIGEPDISWGVQVLITGALWENNFEVVDRLMDEDVPNAFTMPVTTVPETEAFGGGELTRFHPYVIDLLAPEGRSQGSILRSWDAKARRRAAVPMIPLDPAKYEARIAAEPVAKKPPELPRVVSAVPGSDVTVAIVRDVSRELVVLEKPTEPLALYRLGDVLDDGDQVVARVVVSQIHTDFVVATAVEGKDRIVAGARVRFAKPKE
jgi:carbohydrate-binding DOMON domain-containing protein